MVNFNTLLPQSESFKIDGGKISKLDVESRISMLSSSALAGSHAETKMNASTPKKRKEPSPLTDPNFEKSDTSPKKAKACVDLSSVFSSALPAAASKLPSPASALPTATASALPPSATASALPPSAAARALPPSAAASKLPSAASALPSAASALPPSAGEAERKQKAGASDLPAIKPVIQSSGVTVAGKKTTIIINNEEYELLKKTDGDYHSIYEFTQNKTLTIGDIKIPDVRILVLKCATKTPKNRIGQAPLLPHERIKQDIRIQVECAEALTGYEHLLKRGVPVSKVYLKPHNLGDLFNLTNGNFWLIERNEKHRSSEWSEEDFEDLIETDLHHKRLVAFVKEHLTKASILGLEGQEHINDFVPRNVMFDSKGMPCVVDFSKPKSKEWDRHLFEYLLAWSYGKQEIWDFLIKDFPQSIKLKMESSLKERHLCDKLTKTVGTYTEFPTSVHSKN
jgi:hypothetical protein